MTTTAQQQGNNTNCTSPKTPAAELKEFNGAIAALDYDKRILTMHDEHGVTHPFKWTNEAQDEFFQKQRVGYGLTLKYDGETRVLKGANFWRKPDGFNKKAGGRQFVPRNEKIIVAQCLVKAYTELWINTNTPDIVTFADARKEILAAVEEDIGRVMKAGGA